MVKGPRTFEGNKAITRNPAVMFFNRFDYRTKTDYVKKTFAFYYCSYKYQLGESEKPPDTIIFHFDTTDEGPVSVIT